MTILSVYFEEHEDSPIESGNRSGEFSFTRIFIVAWADRFEFLRAMFRDGTYGPQAYSAYWPGLLADKFKIERQVNAPTDNYPVMTDPELEQLQHDCIAKITIDYAPIPPAEAQDQVDLADGTYASYSMTDAIEFVGFPGRTMQWLNTSKALPPDITPIVCEVITRHEVTWHEVVYPPWDLISSMKGKVNADFMRLPGTQQIAYPETIMLTGCQAKKTYKLSGDTAWEITLTFTEKAQKSLAPATKGAINQSASQVYGWNWQYDPEQGEYDKPVTALGEEMFDAADLYSIFT